eukprot:1149404-Pelagomonas_calceolata.AAC.2
MEDITRWRVGLPMPDVVCAEEGRGMRTRGGVIEEAKHDSCKASEAEAALRVVHGLSHCLSLN